MLDRHPRLQSVGATSPEHISVEVPNSGYRFSWGLALVGGVAATAITFCLLTLGAGLGLMLVKPLSGSTTASGGFLTGGAIYFFVAQAFGFAAGGHLAGRLLGPIAESDIQETFRAIAHGLVAWCIAILATLSMISVVGASVVGSGATVAALYTFQVSKPDSSSQVAYLVDVLFRPESATPDKPASAAVTPNESQGNLARAEAGRILATALTQAEPMQAPEQDRLAVLAASSAGISVDSARTRIVAMEADVRAKAALSAEYARRVARDATLWLAASMLFGALVAMASALLARIEDDRESVVGSSYRRPIPAAS